MRDFITKSKEYFNVFMQGNIKGLEDIYDEEIVLKDWTNTWTGKNQVLSANKQLFKNEISVDIKEINQIGSRTYCHINIIVNSEFTLDVLDVIDWSESFKIKKIEAFNGTLQN